MLCSSSIQGCSAQTSGSKLAPSSYAFVVELSAIGASSPGEKRTVWPSAGAAAARVSQAALPTANRRISAPQLPRGSRSHLIVARNLAISPLIFSLNFWSTPMLAVCPASDGISRYAASWIAFLANCSSSRLTS